MADYSNFNDLFSGVTNATCIRNNSHNDDGTDVIPFSDFDFYYNDTKVTNFYVNGNGWIGIGNNVYQDGSFIINDGDQSVYYVYKESATVMNKKVFRIRWDGRSYYEESYVSDETYHLVYDIAFVETGDIVVCVSTKPTNNIYPESDYNGLWIGYTQIASFTLSNNTPIIVTFKPSNPSTGTDFTTTYTYPIYILFYCLIKSQNNLYTVVNNSLTQINEEISQNVFETYGLRSLPDYNIYSSLTNPSILIYSEDTVNMSYIHKPNESSFALIDKTTLLADAIYVTELNKTQDPSDFESIFETVIANGSGDTKLLFITTTTYSNSGHSYTQGSYSYKNNEWISTTDIINDGMTIEEFNSIPKNKWLEILPNDYKVKVYLPKLNSFFKNILIIYNEKPPIVTDNLQQFVNKLNITFNTLTCLHNISLNTEPNMFKNYIIQSFNNYENTWNIASNNFDYIFYNCRNLTSFNALLPTTVTSMDHTFSSCYNLVDAPNIPDSVTSMNYTFSGCYNLVNVPVIPNSVISMNYTFSSCYNLVDAPVIPNSVISMDHTFTFCNNLVNAPVIPNSVTNMYYTFYNCHNITNVPDIPNSVTSMDHTFSNCYNLVDAPNIPDSVTDMYGTFSFCNNLVNAPVIPNSVISMSSTFSYCYNLVNAPVIPNSVTSMTQTFMRCLNLVDAPVIPNSVTSMIGTFDMCINLVNAPVIPNSVTFLSNTFSSCYNLVNAPVIPNSVTSMIGVFSGCSNIVNFPVIPNSVTNISNAFSYCRNLVNAPDIPNSVTNMYGAFNECPNLVDAPVIPNSVTNMSGTFKNCSNLVNAPDIPNSVTDMANTFVSCSNLVDAPVIPNSVTDMRYTFFRCSNLVNAPVIPNSVTNMYGTFMNCYNLVDAPNIPDSVTDMYGTFWNCINLEGDIYIHSNNVSNCTNCFTLHNNSYSLNVYVHSDTTTYTKFISYLKSVDNSALNIHLKTF